MSFIRKLYENEITEMNEKFGKVGTRISNISWPSEASASVGPVVVGECKRSLFYKYLGSTPTEDQSVKGKIVCDVGCLYEKFYIDKFKHLKMFVDEQVRIEFVSPTENKIVISGKLDLLATLNQKVSCIEIKSVTAWKYDDIFGSPKKIALPSASNLMQVLLYKYYLTKTEEGKTKGINDVYLMYVNRNDGQIIWFKVDVDEDGYPIITAISADGKVLHTVSVAEFPSFNDFLIGAATADANTSRIAELKVRAQDVFDRFDTIYNYVRSKSLPEKDFSLVYSEEELQKQMLLGRITKQKYARHKNGTSQYGDFKCAYCPYLKKCLSDSGINLK